MVLMGIYRFLSSSRAKPMMMAMSMALPKPSHKNFKAIFQSIFPAHNFPQFSVEEKAANLQKTRRCFERKRITRK